jgi:asparagine synthase (glutamine-hydrolysing)
MTAIAAIFSRGGQPVEPPLLAAMLATGRRGASDGEDTWTANGKAALAHQHCPVTPEEVGERQPLVHPAGRYAITADARLDNRADLIEALGIPAGEGRALSDAALILRAYVRWGDQCTARLLGDFAFAVWDAVERRLFLARDAMGSRGLAYYQDAQVFVAATDVEQVLAHPAVTPRINEGKVAGFLAKAWDEEETFCEPVRHLPPAHCMTVTSDSVRMWRYWDIDPDHRIRYRSDQEYAEHFRHLLAEAVRCRLRAIGPVGLALSGGSDSMALAAVTTGLMPEMGLPQEHLKSFTYVFDELPSCDEREFIRPVVEQLGLDATYIPCDDRWPLRDLDRWPVERDFAFSDAYVWLPTAIMRAAQAAGCRLLMTGNNGDNLFWDDEYWLAAMAREGRWPELARTLRTVPLSGWWYAVTAGQSPRSLVPQRTRRFYRRLRPRPAPPWLQPELVRRTGLEERLRARENRLRWPYQGQRRLYQTLMGNGAFQDRPQGRRSHRRCGLELVEPFYDRRLAEFVLAVPADQWGRPGRSKWVLRNALAGRLPGEVVERKTKTSFKALWDRGLCERERPVVEALLKEPEIVRRGFVRRDWLQRELAAGGGWTDDGFPLWLCIGLELWLRRWW